MGYNCPMKFEKMVPTRYARCPSMAITMTDILPGARVRAYRESLGLSIREASRRASGTLSHTAISNIETGATPWSRVQLGTIDSLAHALGITTERLMEVATGRPTEVRKLPEPQVGKKSIPVYSLVSAGVGADGGEIVGYIEVNANKKGQRVAYLIEGDSMAPRVLPGAIVEVRLQETARPGVIVVAYIATNGMVCKFLQSITPDGYCILTSDNPKYEPLVVPGDEIHIKGVVEEVRNPAPGVFNGSAY